MILTEVSSNAATAIIMTPIAISASTKLGLDPRPTTINNIKLIKDAITIACSALLSAPRIMKKELLTDQPL